MVAPPGRPGRRAVPIEGPRDVEEELAPILEGIDQIADEADRIRQDARQRAGARDIKAREESEAILEEARQRAAAARAEAAADRTRLSEEEIALVEAQARAETEMISQAAADRLPRLVERVVEQVFSLERVGS
jgi:NACalpha-BTF3-like transcription factor